jgi:D-3-phosphoglycerate dehydrogenase
MDNIDVDYARSRGITVINTPNASSRAVAELAIAHMFALARMIQQSNFQMRAPGADFNGLKKNYSTGFQLNGKTLGILGFGRIGQELAKMALGIGMNVLAVDPVIKSALLQIKIMDQNLAIPIDTVDLKQLLTQSDFISLHVPSGEKPILGKEEFELMKKGACIINTARGGTVDEAALIAALDNGHLGGAGIDAFINEPQPDPSIINHLKVSVTPHIGGSTREAQSAIGKELAEKIIAQYA